jgi:hypothetical protein
MIEEVHVCLSCNFFLDLSLFVVSLDMFLFTNAETWCTKKKKELCACTDSIRMCAYCVV